MNDPSQAPKPVAVAKKKCGRPRTVSDAERKERDRAKSRRYRKTVVALSHSFKAWQTLREKGHWNNAELAEHLLDVHSRFCKQPNCASSKSSPHQLHAVSNETGKTERRNIHFNEKRVEKSSDRIAPLPVHAANIVASYRPIRSNDEFKALGATGGVSREDNVVILPKPVRNENDASKLTAAPVSVYMVVTPQQDITGTSNEDHKEQQEQDVKEEDCGDLGRLETAQGEVELKQVTNVEEFLICENVEPDETGIKVGNGSDQEGHENHSDWGAGVGITIILSDDEVETGDEEGYPSEEGESMKKKRQKLDHQVTGLPSRRLDVAELAKLEGVSGTESNNNKSIEELRASGVTGSVSGENNMTVQPKPVRNQNDASQSESDAALVSVDEVVAPQENITETCEDEQEEEEDGKVGGETVQREVEMKEPTKIDDFLNFGENLEPDETGIMDGNGSDNEVCENYSDCGAAASDHELIFYDADDEDRYSSEEGESLKEKRQKLDHQVTDLPFRRFDVAEVAKAEGISGTESSKIRSKEELRASGVTGSVSGENNMTVQTKPVRNQNDASKSESDAALVSVDEVVAPQENITETCEEEEEDGKVGGETVQREVEMKEPTKLDDFLNFGENLEPDETGIMDGNGSDNEVCKNYSDCGAAASDHELIFNDADDEDRYSSEEGESLKEKRQKLDHQVTDLPFKRFDVAEVAKAEGISGTESSKISLKKLYWTEMERLYRCKICLFEDSNAYSTARHLLQEHAEVVGDLTDYLKERSASDSEPGHSLYDTVMAFPPSSDSTDVSIKGSESCDKIGEEMESVDIPEEGSEAIESKASYSDGTENKENPLDTVESVELLMRWVKLQIICQFCQKVISCRLFTLKGERVIHRCRLGKGISALCDICGKSFSYASFRSHWKSTHGKPEERVCPYCGKMVRADKLTNHIVRCHTTQNDEYLCGICRKGFRSKAQRHAHEVIHQKEKPFKCTYCHRGFTQSFNMRCHMRQHTGEKPYQCNKCKESFAHNVSLKNHLKSKHGIDPWKMGAAGD